MYMAYIMWREVKDSKHNQQTCKSQHQILDKYLYTCIQKHILHSWQPRNILVFKFLGFWSLNHHMDPFQVAYLPHVVLLGEILLFMHSWTGREYFCINFVSWAASVGWEPAGNFSSECVSSIVMSTGQKTSTQFHGSQWGYCVCFSSALKLNLEKMFCTTKVQKSR